MKRILLASALLFLSFTMFAQSSLTYKGGKFYDETGQVLSDAAMSDLIGPDIYYDTYVGAQKQISAGKTLTFSGIGVVVAGVATAAAGGYYASEVLMSMGSLISMAGGGLIDAGVPLWIIGSSRLSWIESDYNRKRDVVPVKLALNAGRDGLGLAIIF